MSLPYQPLVSVIIPTYNRAEQITVALDSLISQTYLNWECLVIDDGSTDNSEAVLKTYQERDSRIRIFQRERLPKGAPTCRNIGLDHAEGSYVIYLDSDDYFLPFCLEQRIAFVNEKRDCDFLIFPTGKLNDSGITKVEIPEYEDYLVPFLSADLPWSIMCPIWKRDLLIELKGFTEGYPRFNDPELMIRALLVNDVRYAVLNQADYDTVFVPYVKDVSIHAQKVYTSLKLFIPDVVAKLNEKKKGYKPYLAMYLFLWFKYFFIPSKSKNILKSIDLINLFFRYGIISSFKWISLMLRLKIYFFSNLINNPIDKLSQKAIYIKRNL